jgi:hypothetical protein
MPAAKGSARTPLGPYMPFIVATYVYASSQGQRTHSARTNFVQKKILDLKQNVYKDLGTKTFLGWAQLSKTFLVK